MGSVWKGLLAISFLVGAAQGAYAKCGDQPGDTAAVLAAREQVQSGCHCDTSTDHGAFVKCAADVANTRAGMGELPKNCKGRVKKCAARSVCGKKSGAVTCCTTNGPSTKCKTAKDAMHCTHAHGTVTGTSTSGCASCCDACPAPGDGPSCVSSPSGAFLD